jgi:phosphatidylserine decarboxylase
MHERVLSTFLTLLPKAALSRAMGIAARSPLPAAAHQTAARLFARGFDVDLQEAELPLSAYSSFQDFFTRRLKPGARPIAAGANEIVSPVDAMVCATGRTAGGSLQAKGRGYSVAALLGDPLDARPFEEGECITLYLSPRDYHRIHAPLDGQIEGYSYIPGKLFPVFTASVRAIPNLFCVNERLITFLSTAAGRVAVVKVGATCVGRIRASYDDVVGHSGRGPTRRRYDRILPIAKGEEIGVFELGSTVIVLFEPGKVSLDPSLAPGTKVKMGQAIGRIRQEGD